MTNTTTTSPPPSPTSSTSPSPPPPPTTTTTTTTCLRKYLARAAGSPSGSWSAGTLGVRASLRAEQEIRSGKKATPKKNGAIAKQEGVPRFSKGVRAYVCMNEEKRSPALWLRPFAVGLPITYRQPITTASTKRVVWGSPAAASQRTQKNLVLAPKHRTKGYSCTKDYVLSCTHGRP